MVKNQDIMKYFPLFSIKALDNKEIKKIIISNFNYDLPICKYFIEKKRKF